MADFVAMARQLMTAMRSQSDARRAAGDGADRPGDDRARPGADRPACYGAGDRRTRRNDGGEARRNSCNLHMSLLPLKRGQAITRLWPQGSIPATSVILARRNAAGADGAAPDRQLPVD